MPGLWAVLAQIAYVCYLLLYLTLHPLYWMSEGANDADVGARFITPWSVQHPLVPGRDKSRPYKPFSSFFATPMSERGLTICIWRI